MQRIKQPKKKHSKAAYIFLLPYSLLFLSFIILPVIIAISLSFTNFNTIERPNLVGFMNYINLLTQDDVFMQKVLPNTIIYSLIVGPGGYVLGFLLAWILAQLPKVPRTIFSLIFYLPSMTGGVAMTVVWRILFSGNQNGYINGLLMNLGLINNPVVWTLDERFILPIMIMIGLWGSMGVGFLAMMAGVLGGDKEIYEAATIDGVSNRVQELIYITIPSMKPQMLFGAVMAIVGAFSNGAIGVQLTGSNPVTGSYAGQLVANHIDDYGFLRYEMGYAAAVSVILLLMIYVFSYFAKKLLSE
ncbi:sugar ABC transporter permease [Enterococcus casseliflavus]|nr:sugar ABC transporter permease [Enterococcus casseliflavus]MRI70751.1 sugar ABC transporter permease [Enterococcus casseliflavus]